MRASALLAFALILASPAFPATAQEPGAAGEDSSATAGQLAALDRLETALAADPEDLPAHNDYRRVVIESGEYDRALAFYERLTADHPDSAYSWLNRGYALVDKIPTVGAITQVILASEALRHFTRSLELERTWVGLYTRGNSYLFWPVVFGRAPLGVADLEAARAMVEDDPAPKTVYVRTWIALGDGYQRTEQLERARETWREGLERFPGDPELEQRLSLDDEALEEYLYELRDPNQRVDTDLSPLWEEDEK